MKRSTPSSWTSESGATLVEICITLGVLTAIIVGVTVQVQSIRKSLAATSRLMSLDAFEASLSGFMHDRHLIEHSVRLAGSQELRNCILQAQTCRPVAQPMALYKEGQKDPFTGRNVHYDFNGQPCKGPCPGYTVETRVIPGCLLANTCQGADYVLIEADIFETGKRNPIRRMAQEMEKYANGLFPGLQLKCPGGASVLRGIGIRGEPLCVPRTSIEFVDQGKAALPAALQVTPLDCQAMNQKPSDQFFISGFNAAGQLSCAPRFW